MDIDRIIAIGTFSVTFLVGISTIFLNLQQRKVAKLDEKIKKAQLKKTEKSLSSLPSTKRKKKSRK